jgi:hypothetical protein
MPMANLDVALLCRLKSATHLIYNKVSNINGNVFENFSKRVNNSLTKRLCYRILKICFIFIFPITLTK